ncbi:MAG: hypothetical protein M0R35_00225 [Candidatus Omnitrophica bacterium]|nr:hypothetical protein [Candidatus Omnitrophota bacterium]
MLKRVLSLIIIFVFGFEQAGFAQVSSAIDLSGMVGSLAKSILPEKYRPLHLRYLSYDNLNGNFRLLLDKGNSKESRPEQLKDTTSELMKYFFVGLSLPNEDFWVNLRPDSPDEMINDDLGRTDVGKILLEADVQLKKDTAAATSPKTPAGKAYWDKLYQKAESLYGSENITIPTLTRPWIVPDEIIVRESQGSAYIYKATLKVMLEQDYLKNNSSYNFPDERSKELNEYSSRIIRETIIPKLTKEINSSKRYAPLRQVYYSLILAQWFKIKYQGNNGIYSGRIDSKDLTNLTSKTAWDKDAYFKAYQKSFKDGEYNIQETRNTVYGQTIRSYFSGGVAWGDLAGKKIIESRVAADDLYRQSKYLARFDITADFSAVSPSIQIEEGAPQPKPVGLSAKDQPNTGAPPSFKNIELTFDLSGYKDKAIYDPGNKQEYAALFTNYKAELTGHLGKSFFTILKNRMGGSVADKVKIEKIRIAYKVNGGIKTIFKVSAQLAFLEGVPIEEQTRLQEQGLPQVINICLIALTPLLPGMEDEYEEPQENNRSFAEELEKKLEFIRKAKMFGAPQTLVPAQYDSGVTRLGGVTYYLQEWIDGPMIAEKNKNNQLTTRDLENIAAAWLNIYKVLGVFVTDSHDENIMLRSDGTLAVIDLGLTSSSDFRMFAGTIVYQLDRIYNPMHLEQFRQAILNGIVKGLGYNDGIEFLRKAYEKTSRPDIAEAIEKFLDLDGARLESDPGAPPGGKDGGVLGVPAGAFNAVDPIRLDKFSRAVLQQRQQYYKSTPRLLEGYEKIADKMERSSGSDEPVINIGPVMVSFAGGIDVLLFGLKRGINGVNDLIIVDQRSFGTEDKLFTPVNYSILQRYYLIGSDSGYNLSEYNLSGIGSIALERIICGLQARIKGVYYFHIKKDGSLQFFDKEQTRNAEDCNNAVIEFIDPKNPAQVKRFWYIQQDINAYKPEFMRFMDKLRFNTLMVKAAYDMFSPDSEVFEYEKTSAILGWAKKSNASIIADNLYPIWLLLPRSIKLTPGQVFGLTGGFGSTDRHVYFSSADRLKYDGGRQEILPAQLDELAAPEWLGKLHEEFRKRNKGKGLAVLNEINGYVDMMDGAWPLQINSNWKEKLAGLSTVSDDDYVYAVVRDNGVVEHPKGDIVLPSQGYSGGGLVRYAVMDQVYRIVVARKSALMNERLLETAYSIHPEEDVAKGNGDILFLWEFSQTANRWDPKENEIVSDPDISIDLQGLYGDLRGKGWVSSVYGDFVRVLSKEFGGRPINIDCASKIALKLFNDYFVPDRVLDGSDISWKNIKSFTGIIPKEKELNEIVNNRRKNKQTISDGGSGAFSNKPDPRAERIRTALQNYPKTFKIVFPDFARGYSNYGEWKENYAKQRKGFIESLPITIAEGYRLHQRDSFYDAGFAVKELINNAFDAVMSYYDHNLLVSKRRPGSYRGEITVTVGIKDFGNAGGSLEIVVKDNGAGRYSAISEEKGKNPDLYTGSGQMGLRIADNIAATINKRRYKDNIAAQRSLVFKNGHTEAVLSLPLAVLEVKADNTDTKDAVIVPEAHYAILAGGKLKTYGLYTCVAVSLWDQDTGTGALIHLTNDLDMAETIKKVVSQMIDEFGVKDADKLKVNIVGGLNRDRELITKVRAYFSLWPQGMVEHNLTTDYKRSVIFNTGSNAVFDMTGIIKEDLERANFLPPSFFWGLKGNPAVRVIPDGGLENGGDIKDILAKVGLLSPKIVRWESAQGAIDGILNLSIPDEQKFQVLVECLRHDNFWISVWAALALGKFGDLRAVDPLLEKLREEIARGENAARERYQVASAVINALVELGDPGAIKQLTDIWQNHPNFWQAKDGIEKLQAKHKYSLSGEESVINDDGGKGGVDFRGLPINIRQAAGSIPAGFMDNMLIDKQATKEDILKLTKDLEEIRRLIESENIPSLDRLKNNIRLCYQKQYLKQSSGQLASCIADMLRMEEADAQATDPQLLEMLEFLELSAAN